MALRRITDPIPVVPQPGEFSLSVSRGLTSTSLDADLMRRYHLERAEAIHELVADSGLTVLDWGHTDAEHPREVVDLVLQASAFIIPSIATVLAAWIAVRSNQPKREDDNRAVPAFSLQLPDGKRLDIRSRDHLAEEAVQELITKFLSGR